MIDLWFVIALVTLFCGGFIGLNVVGANRALPSGETLETRNFFPFGLLLLVFAVAAPLLYANWGSLQKQTDWQTVSQKTLPNNIGNSLKQGELTLQELLLGLRTQAHNNPKNARLWFELGEVYRKLKMQDAVKASWERALRLESNPDWLVAMAQLLTASSHSQEHVSAEYMLQQALAQNPLHQGALLTQGFSFYNSGRFALAIKSWQKLAALDSLSSSSKVFVEKQIQLAQTKIEKSKNE